MWWLLLLVVLWVVGAAVPWGSEELTFRERLADPISAARGMFAVTAAVSLLGMAILLLGLLIEPALRLFE